MLDAAAVAVNSRLPDFRIGAYMFTKKLLTLLVAVTSAVLTACASLQPSAPPAPPRPLVLVSIDAFRADYLERGLTPNLNALAATGARGTMRPSFPSLTFPNHYTLVTGKVPDHHGVVANNMYDPTHPADPQDPNAAYFTKAKSGDGFWWKEAKPMWISAEQAGLKAGIVFWPGSQAEIDHTRPTYWLPFVKAATNPDRVDQLLKWMDLPADQKPQVYLLYLDSIDELGHKKGPDSPELNAGLAEVDAAIGRLRDGLRQRGVDANIVIVSDHGMISVSPERTTYISAVLGKDGLAPEAKSDPRYDVVYWGSVAMLNPRPGHEAELDRLTKTHYDHMQCWHKGAIPARFKFGKNPRVPEIVCLGEPGWQVGGLTNVGSDVGNHGYDPSIPEMRAIFIANGPDIKPGVYLDTFDNVDVYDFEMKLLHLKPEANDGTLAPVRPALK